jgi:putative ABC transport system substrate-binding protein
VRRREFLGLVGGAAVACPFVAGTTQAQKVPRIGILSLGAPTSTRGPPFILLQALRELGYVEDRNLNVEFRWADGQIDRLSELVSDLVRAHVDVIWMSGYQAALAAKKVTKTVPLVVVTHVDPVGTGLVISLANPGGNVTGATIISPDLAGKRLELLREIAPSTSRLAVLINTANPGSEPTVRQTKEAGRSLGLTLQFFDVHVPAEFATTFSSMADQKVEALHLQMDPLFLAQRAPLAALAAKNRIPTIYDLREFVQAGGLMCYGPRFSEEIRRTAVLVHKIFKGASPTELPFEQPTKFELVINLKTAKALGVELPTSLLLRADEVIE